MSRLDIVETIAEMRRLSHAEIMETVRFEHARASYEMHPATRAEMILELQGLPKLTPWTFGFGELIIDGIPVQPNPLLGEGVVRFVTGIRTGRAVRMPEAFTDERRRR